MRLGNVRALGELGSLTPRVDVSYQGDLYTNGANAATNRIESYTLGNARLSESGCHGGLRLANWRRGAGFTGAIPCLS